MLLCVFISVHEACGRNGYVTAAGRARLKWQGQYKCRGKATALAHNTQNSPTNHVFASIPPHPCPSLVLPQIQRSNARLRLPRQSRVLTVRLCQTINALTSTMRSPLHAASVRSLLPGLPQTPVVCSHSVLRRSCYTAEARTRGIPRACNPTS